MKLIVKYIGAAILCCLCALLTVACGQRNEQVDSNRKVSIEISTEGESKVIVTIADRQLLTDDEGKARFADLPPMIYTVKLAKQGFHPEWRQVDVLTKDRETVNVRMRPVIATALITSEPSGANILIDGVERGTTPMVYTDLQFGEYEIQAKLTGTNPVTRKVVFSNEKADRPLDIHFLLASNRGKLSIITEPEDAICVVQETNSQCNTPGELELQEGEYHLSITKDGYKSIKDMKVTVEREKTNVLKLQLADMPGTLEISVNEPDAEVFVNDSKVQDISKPMEVAPGNYTVIARKKGFPDVSESFEITKGQNKKCELNLTSDLGSVTFTINPPGTQISIDVLNRGEKKIIGVSQPDATNPKMARPFVIKGLPAGKHTLYFNHKYAPKQTYDHYEFSLSTRTNETIPEKTLSKFWVANASCTDKENGHVFQAKVLPSAKDSKTIDIQRMNDYGGVIKDGEVPRSKFSSIEELPPISIDAKYNYSIYDLSTGKATIPNTAVETSATETKDAVADSEQIEQKGTESANAPQKKERKGYTLKIVTPLPSFCIVFIDGKSYGNRTEISGLPQKIHLRIQGKQDINATITFDPNKTERILKLPTKQLEKLNTKGE